MNRIALAASVAVFALALSAQAQTFDPIDYPGAQQTWLGGINDFSQVVGYALVGNSVEYFLLDAERNFVPISFDIPDALYVFAGAINNSGQIAGMYIVETSNRLRGFVRDRTGLITLIDYEGAIDTYVVGINNRGQIAGFYGANDPITGWYRTHGFLRERNGDFVPIEYPMATESETGAVSNKGEVVGSYWDGARTRGFLLNSKGQFANVDYPGAMTTRPGISPRGVILGYYSYNPDRDPWVEPHGFYSLKDGTLVTFDPPFAVYSAPSGTNSRGQISGTYWDAVGFAHGYITMLPKQ